MPARRRRPEHGGAWGWRSDEPQGGRIGRVDGRALYLEGTAALAAAQAVGARTGDLLPLGPTTLGRRLRQAGWLAATDAPRRKVTVRRLLAVARREAWAVREGYISLTHADHEPRGLNDGGYLPRSASLAEADHAGWRPDGHRGPLVGMVGMDTSTDTPTERNDHAPLPADADLPPRSPCSTCGGTHYWLPAMLRDWRCAICRPPLNPALVGAAEEVGPAG